MKGCLYLRVSTEDQHPENQLEPLRKLASALDISLVHEYVDRVSGKDANRPEFRDMMIAASRRDFDIILIRELDRFSRGGILETLSHLKKLRDYGVALKSLREPWVDTRDEGLTELLTAVLAWAARQERENISARTKAGLRGKENVGKRGPDQGPRKRSGYLKRWERERENDIIRSRASQGAPGRINYSETPAAEERKPRTPFPEEWSNET